MRVRNRQPNQLPQSKAAAKNQDQTRTFNERRKIDQAHDARTYSPNLPLTRGNAGLARCFRSIYTYSPYENSSSMTSTDRGTLPFGP